MNAFERAKAFASLLMITDPVSQGFEDVFRLAFEAVGHEARELGFDNWVELYHAKEPLSRFELLPYAFEEGWGDPTLVHEIGKGFWVQSLSPSGLKACTGVKPDAKSAIEEWNDMNHEMELVVVWREDIRHEDVFTSSMHEISEKTLPGLRCVGVDTGKIDAIAFALVPKSWEDEDPRIDRAWKKFVDLECCGEFDRDEDEEQDDLDEYNREMGECLERMEEDDRLEMERAKDKDDLETLGEADGV